MAFLLFVVHIADWSQIYSLQLSIPKEGGPMMGIARDFPEEVLIRIASKAKATSDFGVESEVPQLCSFAYGVRCQDSTSFR